nr:hypothetical protein HmN_000579400 [Hymenolepis microstoma]
MEASDQEQEARHVMFCMFKSEQSIEALMASAKAAILEVLPNADISQEDSILNIDGTMEARFKKDINNEVAIKFEYPARGYKKYTDVIWCVGSKHESAIFFKKSLD